MQLRKYFMTYFQIWIHQYEFSVYERMITINIAVLGRIVLIRQNAVTVLERPKLFDVNTVRKLTSFMSKKLLRSSLGRRIPVV